jgi:TetR/AcrR family transcriptional regulator
MARPRAADYDDKRRVILERSAVLFAEHGYDRASVTMIADSCGVSKALLYHYYSDKAQLLFDIIRSHLAGLLAATDGMGAADADPRTHLVGLSQALLDAYRESRAQHQVQLGQFHLLTPEQQHALQEMERRLVDRFAAAIAAAVPRIASTPGLLKPLTMSLFGMLNWNYTWFREDGPLTRSDYAQLAVGLIIGFRPAWP